MPNAKVFIEGKWLAFVSGANGVTNVFSSKESPTTLVVLTKDGIVSYTGLPFVLEREYKTKDIDA